MISYAIDPGKTRTAVAAFRGTEFVGVYFATGETIKIADEHRGIVFMEMPRVYPGSPVRQNDLLDLTAAGMSVGARLSVAGEKVRTIEPARWKGQTPKEIIRERIQRVLTPEERMRVGDCLKDVQSSLRHNLWDAIGIGLFALKRARKGIV